MPRFSATYAAVQKDPSIADKWCLTYKAGIVEGTVVSTKKAAEALLKARVADSSGFGPEEVSKVGDALAKFDGQYSDKIW